MHLTDASSEWSQLWIPIPKWRQSNNPDSDPVQDTSSNQIGPVPCPKYPNDKAIPVIKLISSCYIIYVNYSICKTIFKHVSISCVTGSKERGEYSKMNVTNTVTIYYKLNTGNGVQ